MSDKINQDAGMNILDKIISSKRKEIIDRKAAIPVGHWEKTRFFSRKTISLKESLADKEKTGIIAEFKRKSPSKGVINGLASVEEVTKAYAKFGASGISVLTDHEFFGGSNEDLEQARINEVPILRKDFIVDEYQIVESKGIGADLILLIAACLTSKDVKRLACFAVGIGLEVLLELHSENELGHICEDTELVGINNRNLQTFEVNIEKSLEMAGKIPPEKIRIAESGIDSIEMISLFRENGFSGFLIGENFMKAKDPAVAFGEFANALKDHRSGS